MRWGRLINAVVGTGNALVDVGLFTLPGRLVADEGLARVFGALESLIAMSVGIGAILTAPLITLVGGRQALVVIGLVAPAAALLAARGLRALDRDIVVQDGEINALRSLAMFRPLSLPAIEQLARGLRRATAQAGELITRQGEPGEAFYLVLQGEAEVLRDSERIEVLGPGDHLGEIALLRNVPRAATVRARTRLDMDALERFLVAVSGYRASSGGLSHRPPAHRRSRDRRSRPVIEVAGYRDSTQRRGRSRSRSDSDVAPARPAPAPAPRPVSSHLASAALYSALVGLAGLSARGSGADVAEG